MSRFKGASIFRVVISVLMIPRVLANNFVYFGRFDAYNFRVGSRTTLKMEAEVSTEKPAHLEDGDRNHLRNFGTHLSTRCLISEDNSLHPQRCGNVLCYALHFDTFARRTVYIQRNIGARSCNRCCCGKAKSITYSECVFLAVVIQHAMRMRHIVICDMSGSTKCFHNFP